MGRQQPAWTVTRIDPAPDRITARVEVGDAPRALAVGGGKLWIAVAGTEAAEPAAGLRPDAEVRALTAPPCGRVLTGGRGDADLLIASDLPLRGQIAATLPMAEAVEFVLRSHDFRAGRFRLGYQSCDDATDQYGSTTKASAVTTPRDTRATWPWLAWSGR